jgi:hypothetical protein
MVDQKKMVYGSVMELFLTKIITISIGFPMVKNWVRYENGIGLELRIPTPSTIYG